MSARTVSSVGRFASCMLAVTALASMVPLARAEVRYTVTYLGSPGTDSRAYGINAAGQIVGTYYPTAQLHGYRLSPGATLASAGVDLQTLGGSSSGANAINSSGQTAGFAAIVAPDTIYHAVRTTSTGNFSAVAADLGTLGGDHSYGTSINDAGQVCGYSDLASGARHAFRTTATGKVSDANTDLGTLGGTFSEAYAINAAGQVAGRSTRADGATHAVRTSASGRISDAGADLGTLGGSSSCAYAINAAGQAVGYADIAGANSGFHAFRTTAAGLIGAAGTDLGTLGGKYSTAYAIATDGTVVGASEIVSGGPYHAFICTSGPMLDLNTLIDPASGWTLYEARALNDSGQIVGFGSLGGENSAFLLTPVPEPLAPALLALGSIALLRRRTARP